MPLKIYNTKSRVKEEFQPQKPPQVKMYVCGITVYDYCHLGHARAAVVFDVIYRYLQRLGYQVEYVRNFTDIDDKIINRANESGEAWQELTARFIQAFHEDMAALGNLTPSEEPKATDYIKQMQAMIEVLIGKGVAYSVDGDVFYSVRKFSSYGELAKKNIEDLEVGARVEVHESKKDPLDFALWKAAKPGEPKWDSPWGAGRPGWHIECSAMSTNLLGNTLDIHGGGRDLTFPHHENERAQSEGATGETFARYWVHNGFVNLNADKMSKSTGNFLTIRDVLKEYSFEAVRYFLLSSHYRSPLDFTGQNIKDATAAVERVYDALLRLKNYQGEESVTDAPDGLAELDQQLADFNERFFKAMDDDFNTARALGIGFDLIRAINKVLAGAPAHELLTSRRELIASCIAAFSDCLGIFSQDPEAFFANKKAVALSGHVLSDVEIEAKIQDRKDARSNKDYQLADQVRDELANAGIVLKDNPDGSTTWTIK